ncbi:ABC transporter substrate-binding protein [Paenibacillus eucommiae]|uniref:Iron complex transport system substrate-binding protein n=1 Tax=Paenibacillus eucommiae TaxID=1355755 RepID=A0ABS4IVN0_9BACL|nr:iron-siderophore ABC transporter substrate-binding protein [Paenibacillus eucommiae]MBP1991647.1 iron complex transport system substrate-binding protein [Paenibacillus eucommiae]
MQSKDRANSNERGKSNQMGKAALGLVLLFLAIVLAACGSKENQNVQPSATQEVAQAQTSEPVQTEIATATATPEASATKLIKHVYGETTIAAQPKRIVSIGLEDMLLSLEVPLVLADGMEGHYLYKRLQEQKIPMLYSAGGINYEAILAAQPDLILTSNGYADQAVFEKLSQIAPTLAYNRDDWKASITEIGKALDREEKVNSVIQAYDDKLKQARETIIQKIGNNKTVGVIRPSEKEVQLFFPGFEYVSVLYDDLGLSPAASIQDLQKTTKDEWGISLSLEKLPELNADYLFVTAGGSLQLETDFQKAMDTVTSVEQMNIWKTIPAVKQNQVYKLSARHWMLSGPIAEGMKMDDIVQLLTVSK